MKKKVVIITEPFFAGLYFFIRDLSNYLAQNHFEVFVIYSSIRNQDVSTKFTTDFNPEIRFIELNMAREISPIQDIKHTLQLYKLLKQINPDIVHTNCAKAGVIGRIATRMLFRNIKLFYSPHGYSFLQLNYSKKNRTLYKIIETVMSKLTFSTTIACGDSEYLLAKKISKAELIRNGIKVKGLHKKTTVNDRKIVGILGRITFPKNPKLFNEIALQNPKYRFIWLGDGELRHELSAPNIEITGFITDEEEKFKILSSFDVYFQPSLWEGLPLAVLEAMSVDLPLVVSNVSGNKDLVINYYNGFTFNNIKEANEKINYIFNHNIVLELGKNSSTLLKNEFDMEKNYAKFISVYHTS